MSSLYGYVIKEGLSHISLREIRGRVIIQTRRDENPSRSPDKITEAMDQALGEIGEAKDEFVSAASRRRLEQTEW